MIRSQSSSRNATTTRAASTDRLSREDKMVQREEQKSTMILEYHGAGTRYVCEDQALREDEEEWESLPEGFDKVRNNGEHPQLQKGC